MKVIVITPEKKVLDKEAKSVNIPTLSGRITILPHHTELISVISPGKIAIDQQSFFSDGGVVEVFNDKVTILLKKYIEGNSN